MNQVPLFDCLKKSDKDLLAGKLIQEKFKKGE